MCTDGVIDPYEPGPQHVVLWQVQCKYAMSAHSPSTPPYMMRALSGTPNFAYSSSSSLSCTQVLSRSSLLVSAYSARGKQAGGTNLACHVAHTVAALGQLIGNCRKQTCVRVDCRQLLHFR